MTSPEDRVVWELAGLRAEVERERQFRLSVTTERDAAARHADEAEAKVAAVEALADEWEASTARIDRGFAQDLRAALASVGRTARTGGCMDCGRQYGDAHGFPDLVVPDDVWEKVNPGSGGGGLLCPSCLCHRAATAGVVCEAAFTSGPFVQPGWRKPLASVGRTEPAPEATFDVMAWASQRLGFLERSGETDRARDPHTQATTDTPYWQGYQACLRDAIQTDPQTRDPLHGLPAAAVTPDEAGAWTRETRRRV